MKRAVKVFLCEGACTFFILELVLALSVDMFAYLLCPLKFSTFVLCISHDGDPGPDVTPAPLVISCFPLSCIV